MMAGNPNWWSMMNGMHPHESHHHHQQQQQHLSNSHQFAYGTASNSSLSSNSSTTTADDDHHHPAQDHFPPVRSWSQLLLGGLGGGEDQDRFGGGLFQQQKRLQLQQENNWDDQNQLFLNLNPSSFTRAPPHVAVDHVKQENINNTAQTSCTSHLYDDNHSHHRFQLNNRPNSSTDWLLQHQGMPVSSPTSCITTLSNNILNFSGGKAPSGPVAAHEGKSHRQHNQDHSSECNSTSTGGAAKKARVQQSSAQPALKVRKEKLGDRITALHQLVSPFGKTDTASVLSEAIGYIRFLQGQIEALSSPYMRNGSGSTTGHHHQHSVQDRNCLFPQEPTQFLNNIGIEARGASKLQDSTQSGRGGGKDLRSRGLCLVPISCTQNVANDSSGADYWAPAALGGGGF